MITKGEVRKKFWASNIGFEYWDYKLKDYERVFNANEEEIRTVYMNYYNHLAKMRKEGVGLLFFGTNGTGKTGLAMEIGKKALLEGYKVRFYTLAELVETYTASWRRESAEQMLEDVNDCDFLIIDDVGKEKRLSEKQDELVTLYFENIYRLRARWNRPVITTTNSTPENFGNIVGESLVSLIRGTAVPMQLVGDDFRARKGSKLADKLKQKGGLD